MKSRLLKTKKRKTMKRRNKKTLTYKHKKKHFLKGGMNEEEEKEEKKAQLKALAARFKKPAPTTGPVTITKTYAPRPADLVRFSDPAVEQNVMAQVGKTDPGTFSAYKAQRLPDETPKK